jgi:hypothetical protein
MATVQNILDSAARKVGITSLSSDDLTNALEDLNNLLGVLGIEFLAPYITRENKTLTIGDAEYTIGSSGDLNTVRPTALVDIYIQDSNGYDYPIEVINGADYNDITIKTTEARPEKVYFLPEYPLAKVIFDCEPDEAYVAYFEFQKGFTEYTSVNDTVTLPNEYKSALIYNLAVMMAEDHSIVPNKTVLDTAQYTRLLISRLGAINRPPKEASFEFNKRKSYQIETGAY